MQRSIAGKTSRGTFLFGEIAGRVFTQTFFRIVEGQVIDLYVQTTDE